MHCIYTCQPKQQPNQTQPINQCIHPARNMSIRQDRQTDRQESKQASNPSAARRVHIACLFPIVSLLPACRLPPRRAGCAHYQSKATPTVNQLCATNRKSFSFSFHSIPSARAVSLSRARAVSLSRARLTTLPNFIYLCTHLSGPAAGSGGMEACSWW